MNIKQVLYDIDDIEYHEWYDADHKLYMCSLQCGNYSMNYVNESLELARLDIIKGLASYAKEYMK